MIGNQQSTRPPAADPDAKFLNKIYGLWYVDVSIDSVLISGLEVWQNRSVWKYSSRVWKCEQQQQKETQSLTFLLSNSIGTEQMFKKKPVTVLRAMKFTECIFFFP